ncbi:MAG TPA: GYD domain-containing protein [candidate division Zixibacteria bacterium]|nr:GYD domain-containing protein [candidate division Zixibacteria bacterium]
MPKYLVQANYVGEGIKGLLKEGGSSRRTAVEKLFESVGGKVEAFYYAFGDTDLFVIADIPDNVTAAGLSLIVSAAGTATAKVTVLLTAEEIDAAAKKTPSYRPPGQ